MPKLKGGMGAGSMAMGGGGKKPSMPPTPFGGPAPGASQPGAMMGVQPRGGGMGPRAASGAGVKAFAHGGGVKHDDEAADKKLFSKMINKHDEGEKKGATAYAHGGPVIAGHATHGMSGKEHPKEQGISRGSDMRRSAGPKGAESRVRRPHSGKAS